MIFIYKCITGLFIKPSYFAKIILRFYPKSLKWIIVFSAMLLFIKSFIFITAQLITSSNSISQTLYETVINLFSYATGLIISISVAKLLSHQIKIPFSGNQHILIIMYSLTPQLLSDIFAGINYSWSVFNVIGLYSVLTMWHLLDQFEQFPNRHKTIYIITVLGTYYTCFWFFYSVFMVLIS